jgi:hypothetical protein
MALAKRLVALMASACFVLGATLIAAPPAAAIMNGVPDGTAHRSVGMVGALMPGNVVIPVCTGFLVSRRVVVTAGHCTVAIHDLGASSAVVSFSANLAMTLSPAFVGAPVTHPEYTGEGFDRRDFGAVVFTRNITSIQPVRLPTAGLLDELRADQVIRDMTFTAVGYGAVDRIHENELPDDPDTPGKSDGDEDAEGPWIFLSNLKRNRAVSDFNALNREVLRLGQNPALDLGGTCHGDSGGPYFVSVDGHETAVALTVTGDHVCQATTAALRLDTPAAREFLTLLGVTLP